MTKRVLLLLLLTLTAAPAAVGCQGDEAETAERGALIAAAREIMAAARYCTLITVDASGRPQARAMDPFPPEEDLVVWLGTHRGSRKVEQIRADARVALYYFDREGGAYVTINGTARLVDDPAEKARRWKEGWEEFYPDRATYLLIRVTPERLEIVSEKHGILGDPETWTPPAVTFGAG